MQDFKSAKFIKACISYAKDQRDSAETLEIKQRWNKRIIKWLEMLARGYV